MAPPGKHVSHPPLHLWAALSLCFLRRFAGWQNWSEGLWTDPWIGMLVKWDRSHYIYIYIHIHIYVNMLHPWNYTILHKDFFCWLNEPRSAFLFQWWELSGDVELWTVDQQVFQWENHPMGFLWFLFHPKRGLLSSSLLDHQATIRNGFLSPQGFAEILRAPLL